MKGTKLIDSDTNALTTQRSAARTGFFRRLWRCILQFDDALNFDPRSDLVHRVRELETQIHASGNAIRQPASRKTTLYAPTPRAIDH